MESFFSSLKTERIGKKVFRTRDEARAEIVSRGVAQLAMKIAAISRAGLPDQRATTGRLIGGSSLKGVMLSSVM